MEKSFTYYTKTKTDNGLKKELINKYKIAYDIKTTTRIYNIDDSLTDCIFFDIEKPSKGEGTIKWGLTCNNEVFARFKYTKYLGLKGSNTNNLNEYSGTTEKPSGISEDIYGTEEETPIGEE